MSVVQHWTHWDRCIHWYSSNLIHEVYVHWERSTISQKIVIKEHLMLITGHWPLHACSRCMHVHRISSAGDLNKEEVQKWYQQVNHLTDERLERRHSTEYRIKVLYSTWRSGRWLRRESCECKLCKHSYSASLVLLDIGYKMDYLNDILFVCFYVI